MCWNSRTFSAASGNSCLHSMDTYIYFIFFTQKNNCFPGEGAFCNGIKIHVSQTNKVSHIFSFCAFVVLD